MKLKLSIGSTGLYISKTSTVICLHKGHNVYYYFQENRNINLQKRMKEINMKTCPIGYDITIQQIG